MRQANKIFDGMADEIPVGKNSYIDYIILFRANKYWVWEVQNIRSCQDMTAHGPSVNLMF